MYFMWRLHKDAVKVDLLAQAPEISIIDDDDSVRISTSLLVRSLGFITHTFASAKDFLDSPHLTGTGCLIVDVQMPAMTGIELQDLLRAQGHRVPIIFISAFPDQSIKTQALEGGALCFLSKPFQPAALIEYINLALSRRDEAKAPD
jgi:FixJ family two-component response regulator